MRIDNMLETSRENYVVTQNPNNPTQNPGQEFTKVAEAGSFEELEEVMPNLVVPKGGRIRIVMQLSMPVAWAFDLPGAETIFRAKIPDGLTLIDVWGEGWSSAVVEVESDPAWLVAIGVFLRAHWVALSLLAIGLTLALGALVTGVAILVTAVTAPGTLKWVALAVVGGVATLGVAYMVTRPRPPPERA